MEEILIVKTAALGDVLRTTSILPGLGRASSGGARVTWLTAEAARDLVLHHPLVADVVLCDPGEPASLDAARARLFGRRFERVLSFDDEEPLCRLASGLDAARLSGACLGPDGRPTYTPDVAEWFDMGLLSVHGREEADRRKAANRRTHPQIFADMLGIEPGRPELPLSEDALARARSFAAASGLDSGGAALVGLNTGAGGRWTSKRLPVARTVELAERLYAALDGRAVFLVFGGPAEAGRNARILEGLGALPGGPRAVDAGCDNALLDFAARVDLCDLVVTSDSLALHVAVARGVRVVAFFAPTSAAEIELYGLGEKVASTAPDSCSYRPDADTSTLTVERLEAACLRTLAPAGR